MHDIHKMGDDVARGMQSHDHALIGKVCEDIQGLGRDSHQSQAQFKTSMQELSKDLHQKGILKDLEIVGADGQKHELIARDAQNRTVLIDDMGNRSDSARQMAEKQSSAVKDLAKGGDTSAALRAFKEAQNMVSTEMKQLPAPQALDFSVQVNQLYRANFSTHPALLVNDGQNYRHMTGSAMR